jgi:5-methylcytosine-specific restriction endonuclease McrA
MIQSSDRSRQCFLPPIPELALAADRLSLAADAVLRGQDEEAEQWIVQADLAVLSEFSQRITGKIDPAIHWQSRMPTEVVADRVKQRMPSASVEYGIYQRDGWRCRFCEIRIISPLARRRLVELYPSVARWGRANREKHHGLSALTATLDHILPHSRGGTNEESNLVAACGMCQFGRGHWTLEEVGFTDPRDRPPIVDAWDGLTRLLR